MFWTSAFVTDVHRVAVFREKPQHNNTQNVFANYKLIRMKVYVKS